jgi:hypothetical protein
MPKSRAIDETPFNHHTFLEFLDCMQLEFENLTPMTFLEERKTTTLSMRFMNSGWVACNAFHRVALFHVGRFNYPFVKLYPMLDAFCSSEFFRETLFGARRVYLDWVSTKVPQLNKINAKHSACLLHIFPHLWHLVARRQTRIY